MNETILSLIVFIFGIITGLPFIRNVYGHDVAACMYNVARNLKGDVVFYKETPHCTIGHFTHIFLMQRFFDKYNTTAFNFIVCVYNALTSFVLFWVLSNIFGTLAGLFGSCFYSIYIKSPRLDGNWASFEQFIPLPLFTSLLCILQTGSGYSLFWLILSGFLFGYAILIKQTSILYFPGFILAAISVGHSLTDILIFTGGILISNLIPLVYYSLRHNAFWSYLIAIWLISIPMAVNPKKFNKYYPRINVRGDKKSINKKTIIFNISRSLPPVLLLTITAIIFLLFNGITLLHMGLLLCLGISVLMLFMRGTFFPHYWLHTIPWLSIFAGFSLSEITSGFINAWPPEAISITALLAIGFLIYDAVRVDKHFYGFPNDEYSFLKRVYGDDVTHQYKTQISIGKYIRNTTKEDDKIIVCGWAPHILLYADRPHFTKEYCLYYEDYIKIHNRDNPNYYVFLEEIFKFKKNTIVKQSENPFHSGYPAVIVFGSCDSHMDGFEELAGIKYSVDKNAGGYPLFRPDLELTELMALYENKENISDILGESCNDLKEKIKKMMESENYEQAIPLITKLVHLEPDCVKHLLMIGDCLIYSGKHMLLFNFYQRLIRKNLLNNSLKLHLINKIGESYFHQNDLEKAKEVFKDVLKHDLNNIDALNNIGVIHYRQNDIEKAIHSFNRVLSLDPDNMDAKNNMTTIG